MWPCMADMVAGYWVSLVLAPLEREQYHGNELLSIYNDSFFFLNLMWFIFPHTCLGTSACLVPMEAKQGI